MPTQDGYSNGCPKVVFKKVLKRDRQNFVPHLTVTRIKQLKDKELFFDIISEYKDEFIQDLKVEEIILFESILERSGAVYNIVERFPLKKT